MSQGQNIRAVVLLADYIGTDAVGGKLNALGAGFTISGLQPHGATAPQYVAVLADLPANRAGDTVPVTLELRDEDTGSLVIVPDQSGASQAARIQQLLPVQRPSILGVYLPNDLPCRVQTILGFPMGLPLTAGHHYAWKLEIDGQRLKGWSAHFYVPAAPPAPVIGGPAGPADIPDIESPVTEEDDEPDLPA